MGIACLNAQGVEVPMRTAVAVAALLSLLLFSGVSENDPVPPGVTYPRPNRGLARLLIANDAGESWSQFNSLPEGGTRTVLGRANVARLNMFWRIALPELTDGAPVYINDAELVTLKGNVEKGSSAITIAKSRSGSTYLYMTI